MPSLSELLGPGANWASLLALLAVVASVGFVGRLWQSRNAPTAAVLLVLVSTLSAFCVIAWQVNSQGPLIQPDVALAQWLQGHRIEWLTMALQLLTQLHNPVPVTVLMAICGLVLLIRHQYRWLATFMLTAIGGTTLNVTLKHLFVRVRFVDEHPVLPAFSSFSFPSGHVAAAALLYGFIAVYLMSTLVSKRARFAALGLTTTMILLVAFSRLYLGAHYLSDVVAAAILASFWLTVSVYVVRESAGPEKVEAP